MAAYVNIEDSVIARLKTQGMRFEILVDCDKALLLKKGNDIDISDVLASGVIFTDSKKGEKASENELKQIFGTDDCMAIAQEIIRKGEIQLTAEHRKTMLEQKRKKIMAAIQQNGVDPKTHIPHPMTRIENAFEHANIKIDEFKDVKLQVQEIVRQLLPILPIKFEIKEIQLTIAAEFAPKSHNAIASFGRKLREEWQNDGSLVVVLEIPGGLEQELYDNVNAVCHGNVAAKVLAIR
ncbi:MAG: ribosome assembly factor SBDS [Nanoarchaeota archaeon]|nr:ribosome assembly factor SBDS [Nanoarchaeota archaeon]